MKIGVDLTKLNPGKQGINHYCEGIIKGLILNKNIMLTIYLRNENLKMIEIFIGQENSKNVSKSVIKLVCISCEWTHKTKIIKQKVAFFI